MKDLPGEHPVSKAVVETMLPQGTRPPMNSTERQTPKDQTQLQGIKQQQKQYSGLSKGELTKLLEERTNQAWEQEFNKVKARSQHYTGNYFQKYQWQPNNAIQANCERTISSAYYMLKLGHEYLKSYLKRIDKTSTDLYRCGIKETTDHLLLSCLNYSTFWPDCLKGSKPLYQILNKKERRLEVLQFI
jgi:hypothetical protein